MKVFHTQWIVGWMDSIVILDGATKIIRYVTKCGRGEIMHG
jgi:hypothetical protein